MCLTRCRDPLDCIEECYWTCTGATSFDESGLAALGPIRLSGLHMTQDFQVELSDAVMVARVVIADPDDVQ